jgi:hypothetical protein
LVEEGRLPVRFVPLVRPPVLEPAPSPPLPPSVPSLPP